MISVTDLMPVGFDFAYLLVFQKLVENGVFSIDLIQPFFMLLRRLGYTSTLSQTYT